jgi:hypothetical protein
MISRAFRGPRMKIGVVAMLALASAALVVPNLASALDQPAITSPGPGDVLNASWDKTISFTTATNPDPTATGYTLLRSPKTGACDIGDVNHIGPTAGPSATSIVDSSVTDGAYCYWIEATDGVGVSDSSPVDITYDATDPVVAITGSKPANPTSATVATFTFTADSGTVECKLDTGAFSSCSSPKSLSGLSEASHTFTVRSTDAAGNVGSDFYTWTVDHTAPVVTITGGQPANPTSATNATFTFTADSGSVECKLDGAAFSSCSSPKSLSGLSDGSHTFTVRSTDAAGNVGSDSYTWTVDHSPASVPGNFQLIGGTPRSTKPQFIFDPSTDPHTPITYRLYKDGIFTGVTGTSPITDTTMATDGTGDGFFTYTLTATDSLGNESALTVGVPLEIRAGAPSVPGGLHAVASPTRSAPVISWNASTGTPSAYRVFRNGQQIGTVNAPATTFSDPLPLDGSADADYSYTVVAIDSLSNASAASLPLHVVLDTTRPASSLALAAAASPTAAKPVLIWPASVSSDVAGYNVYRGTTKLNGGLVTTTSFTDSALVGDGTYTYTVRAVDQAGNESTDSTSATVLYDTTAPGTPGASAVAAATGGTASLTWAPASDSGSGVVSYQVRRSPSGGAAPINLAEGTPVCGVLATSATGCGDAGLTPGGSYRYSVFAIDKVGNVSMPGETSTISVPSTLDKTPPKTPTVLHAVVSNGKITLTWKNPKGDFAGVSVVLNAKRAPRSARDGSVVYHGSSAKVTVKLPKLSAGKLVRFAVFAADKAGNTSPAARTTITMPKPSPVSLAPNGKLAGDPDLTWNAVTGATYYNVQVFEGTQASKRVGISWPTVTKWTLPGKYMQKGKVYTWYVWPGIGAKSSAKYGKLIGKVTFTYTG